MEFKGEFETHFTVELTDSRDIDALKAWATDHNLKCIHIILENRYRLFDESSLSQPMLTRQSHGTLASEMSAAEAIKHQLQTAGFPVTRIKIEAAPWNEDIPQTLADTIHQPPANHFEHHVKLLLEPSVDPDQLRSLLGWHGHLSRNALRQRADGRHERFVTQRCWEVGRDQARQSLDTLLAAIPAEGITILEVEEEYVVYDSNNELDRYWISQRGNLRPKPLRVALSLDPSAEQRTIFDPALKHYSSAYRIAPPAFATSPEKQRWMTARRTVLSHLLRLIAGSEWRDKLVLQGSLCMQAWFGDAAREPGDIDWIFQPKDIGLDSREAGEVFKAFKRLATAHPTVGDTTIDTDLITIDDIWTYERADGRRIVFPWRTSDGLNGSVQMDVVFGIRLWEPPIEIAVPTPDGDHVVVQGITPALALGWKLLWLITDCYAQGKDLYDAVLLAESVDLAASLIEQVLSEIPKGDFQVTPKTMLDVMAHINEGSVDWDSFQKEYPWVGEREIECRNRLRTALFAIYANQETLTDAEKATAWHQLYGSDE